MSKNPHPIPFAALDDRLAFIGTSGSGKTYAAGTVVERLLEEGARVVVVDPLDVWYGLRLKPNGKDAGFPVVIFGGEHADVEITEGAGALIGETVATMLESCIVSTGKLPTKAAARRFMIAFLEALDRHATREPVHLVFDEADLWAPQRTSEPMLQSRMEEIVRRGRVKGFVPWLITQRPAVLSKDVLSQADGVVAMKLTGAHDRKALAGWVEAMTDRAAWREIDKTLPTLQTGQGYVWIPGRDVLELATFPKKATFDSSRTPQRGEKIRRATPTPIDLEAVKARLADLEAAAKPKGKAPAAGTGDAVAFARVRTLDDSLRKAHARIRELERQVEMAHAQGYRDALTDTSTVIRSMTAPAFYKAAQSASALPAPKPDAVVTRVHLAGMSPASAKRVARHIDAQRSAALTVPAGTKVTGWIDSGYPGSRPPGEGPERKPLQILARFQREGLLERQWSTLAAMSFKGGAWNRYRGRLRQAGLVEQRAGRWYVTPAGLTVAGPLEPAPPPGRGDLVAFWIKAMGPAGRLLEALAEIYPNGHTRETLAEAVGMAVAGGAFVRYVGTLNSHELIEKRGDVIAAAPWLFDALDPGA